MLAIEFAPLRRLLGISLSQSHKEEITYLGGILCTGHPQVAMWDCILQTIAALQIEKEVWRDKGEALYLMNICLLGPHCKGDFYFSLG